MQEFINYLDSDSAHGLETLAAVGEGAKRLEISLDFRRGGDSHT